MRLDDPAMLPALSRQMDNMADLLRAEETVLEQVRQEIVHSELQLTISTATTGLARHERILGLPTNSEALLVDRRSRIVAKLLGQGTVTPELLRHVAASFSNGEVEIVEHPEAYRFNVKFVGTLGTPPNMADLSAALEEIKPAHLAYRYLYRYLLIREIHEVMTLAILEAQTLDKFAF